MCRILRVGVGTRATVKTDALILDARAALACRLRGGDGCPHRNLLAFGLVSASSAAIATNTVAARPRGHWVVRWQRPRLRAQRQNTMVSALSPACAPSSLLPRATRNTWRPVASARTSTIACSAGRSVRGSLPAS